MFESNATFVGRVVSSVDYRTLPDGSGRAYFRIACTERRRDKITGDWVDGDKLFIPVICWRRLADNVRSSLGIGDPVVVRGRMFTRRYETEGRPMSITELEAYAVGPDLAHCSAVVHRVRSGVVSTQAAEAVSEAIVAAESAAAGAPTGAEPAWERELVSVGGGAEAADTR
jgi:single-strand DNA-binding protein